MAQTYTLTDISNSIKTFDSHIVFLQTDRIFSGVYNDVKREGFYFKITLQGETRDPGAVMGTLTKTFSFDARDISPDIKVVPIVFNSSETRWDVIFKTKGNLNLVHISEYFILTGQANPSANAKTDLNTFNIMFCSLDAANRFKKIAKAVFK
jgi:hypothetical protein